MRKWWGENKERILRQRSQNNGHRANVFRDYYSTQSGKESIKNAVKRYEVKNPEKRSAWGKANRRYKENTPCVVCGNTPSHKHHPDYRKPLEIIYLCPLHHKQMHHKNV